MQIKMPPGFNALYIFFINSSMHPFAEYTEFEEKITSYPVPISSFVKSVKNADKILVLNSGNIVEEGTHQKLMEKKGYYYRLVSAQNNVEVRQ